MNKMNERVSKLIVYNAIRTPDGTILESTHRHDYKSYVDDNGHEYMVDGGLDYLRRYSRPDHPAEELSVCLGDGHERVRDVIAWGTYGKDGKQPYRRIKLKDMDTDHIKACLETQDRMSPQYRIAFENELEFRNQQQ